MGENHWISLVAWRSTTPQIIQISNIVEVDRNDQKLQQYVVHFFGENS